MPQVKRGFYHVKPPEIFSALKLAGEILHAMVLVIAYAVVICVVIFGTYLASFKALEIILKVNQSGLIPAFW